MRTLFWITALLLGYTIVGYPVLAFLRYRLFFKPVVAKAESPQFSVVIAARNAKNYVNRKLDTIFKNSPAGLKEVIFVSDGSTDGTNEAVEKWSKTHPVRLLSVPAGGKTVALTAGIAACDAENILFMDIRQVLEPGSISALLAPLGDPNVGAVSGALTIGAPGENRGDGETVKMGLENQIREWEAGADTLIGVTGAFYVARRALLPRIPAGVILDDMYVPLHIVRNGGRVVFAKDARAWDDVEPTIAQEFRRKVRTLTGNYQLMQLMPWVLNPFGRVFFEFFSHKVLRLLLPFLLILFAISALLSGGMFYLVAFIAELLFVAFGLLGMGGLVPKPLKSIGSMVGTFTLLSAAALVAFGKSLRQDYDVWVTP